MWTGIPVFKLTEAETKKLIRMEEELHKRVIGQNVAIEAVSKAIRRSRAGIKDPKRPAGSFIFLGPSGVGKTELARTLAEFLFGDEDSMIRIDMSEYMEKHAVSRLVGSPPGYVGYDEGGQLTEAVRRKPYSVLLLDEIEKAHPDVFNILLQILEDGRLTDAQGRTVDFRNTIVIMTSNVGAKDIARNVSFGFAMTDDDTGASYEDMKGKIMGDLKKVFRPEFLNRIDEVIVFHKLSREEIREIIDLLITPCPRAGLRARAAARPDRRGQGPDRREGLGPRDGRPPAAPCDPALHRGSARRRGAARRHDHARHDRGRRARRVRRRGGQAAEAQAREASQAPREEEGARRESAPAGTTRMNRPQTRHPSPTLPPGGSQRSSRRRRAGRGRETPSRAGARFPRPATSAWPPRAAGGAMPSGALDRVREMAKQRSTYVCQSCAHEALAWSGRCAGCGEWNTLVETAPAPARSGGSGRRGARAAGAKPVALRDVATPEVRAAAHRHRRARSRAGRRARAGLAGAPGRRAGDRQVDDHRHGARQPRRAPGVGVLYVSGEESAAQVRLRAERLGPAALEVPAVAETSLEQVLATLEAERPQACVIDSIQTMHAEGMTGAPGSVGQVREAATAIMEAAKRLDCAVILVGHVTKEGAVAGPRVLEHLVDCVLFFEGERERHFRTLRALKNRFGATSEVGVFEMRAGGLVEVEDASARFVAEASAAPGSVVLCSMEGTRPLLVEVQALVAPTEIVPPAADRQRASTATAWRWSSPFSRATAGPSLPGADVFVNVAGGVRVDEPGADLAVALALASAHRGEPLRDGDRQAARVFRRDRADRRAARRGPRRPPRRGGLEVRPRARSWAPRPPSARRASPRPRAACATAHGRRQAEGARDARSGLAA